MESYRKLINQLNEDLREASEELYAYVACYALIYAFNEVLKEIHKTEKDNKC